VLSLASACGDEPGEGESAPPRGDEAGPGDPGAAPELRPGIEGGAPSPSPCVPPRLGEITAAFAAEKDRIAAYVTRGMTRATKDPYSLYNAQLETASLLLYADEYSVVELLESLASVYALAKPGLTSATSYLYTSITDGSGALVPFAVRPIKRASMWVTNPAAPYSAGFENPLTSMQFVYAVTRLSRVVAELPASRRTPALTAFVDDFRSVIVEDHLSRLIVGRAGEPGVYVRSTCNRGVHLTHAGLMMRLLTKDFGTNRLASPVAGAVPSCNAVTDGELWTIATAVEALAANDADPSLFAIPPTTRSALAAYTKVGLDTVRARTVEIQDEQGPLAGFDEGISVLHGDYAYAGDTAPSFPGWTDPATKEVARPPRRNPKAGWDVSHARRWVSVFDTFRRQQKTTGHAFPTDATLAAYARKLRTRVFVESGGKIRFNNYMDGSNGWYRVNYSNRPGFGYAPFGIGVETPRSGFGFWSQYDPSIGQQIEAFVRQEKLESTKDQILITPSLVPLDSTGKFAAQCRSGS
jgi:hypothetical protein